MRSSIKKHKHTGWLIERCRFSRKERAFAETWMEENRKSSHTFWNDRLQNIFIIDRSLFSIFGKSRKTLITARDRFIVATVIQWLGTNVGWCFLEEALKRAGFKIVSDLPNPERAYYRPFDKEQNASNWNNLRANPELPMLPDRMIRTEPFRKKHLMRHRPGLPGKPICIRCGYIVQRIGESAPNCLFDQESIQRRDEHQSFIDAPDERPRARIIGANPPANGIYELELQRMLKGHQIYDLVGQFMIINGMLRKIISVSIHDPVDNYIAHFQASFETS